MKAILAATRQGLQQISIQGKRLKGQNPRYIAKPQTKKTENNPKSSVMDGSRLGDQQSVLVMRMREDEESIAAIKIYDDGRGAHVTDSKALYDLLNRRSGNAGQCRRAQIDVAVICISAKLLRATTYWVPGSVMLADPLTKRLGNSILLRRAMQAAKYSLVRPTCDLKVPPEGWEMIVIALMSHADLAFAAPFLDHLKGPWAFRSQRKGVSELPLHMWKWFVAPPLYWCFQRRCLCDISVSPQLYWCLQRRCLCEWSVSPQLYWRLQRRCLWEWSVSPQLYWRLQRRCLWEWSVSPQLFWCLQRRCLCEWSVSPQLYWRLQRRCLSE